MKRFLAFEYGDYYPTGGRGDFKGDFDQLETAMQPAPVGYGQYLDVLDTTQGEWLEFSPVKGAFCEDTCAFWYEWQLARSGA